MSMSLWSGRTLYAKQADARGRDLFVPQGYVAEDAAYCWRVKQDPTSGKFFFVNAAGLLDKRWRLPDIHDERFVRELTAKLATSSSAVPNSIHTLSGKSTPSRNVSVVTSAGGTAGDGGGYDALVASSPALYVASPYQHHHRTGATTSREGSNEQQRQGTPPPPPTPPPASGSAAETAPPAFVYDDADWQALQAKREQVAELRRRDNAMRMEQALEVYEMDRGIGPGGHPATTAPHHQHPHQTFTSRGQPQPVPHHRAGGGTPYDAFVDYNATAHHNAVQRELNKRRNEHDDRQRAMQQELAALELEERQLQEQASRDDHKIRRLEEAQMQALRSGDDHHTAARGHPLSDAGGTTHTPNFSSDSYNSGGVSQAPALRSAAMPTTAATHHRAGSSPPLIDPYAQHQSHHPLPSSDAPNQLLHLTSVIQTLQKLLEHERQNNEKLQAQLEDKERAAMEQLAAEAEREQREIAMRIRMLEAIAAHRREVQLMEEEQRAKASSAEESLRAQLFRGSGAGRYVPEHPLMDQGDY